MKLHKNKIEDLDLIPLMNLFVTMIPLLLLCAAFYHIGMVSVSVPTQSDEESDVDVSKAAVTMSVQITPAGYTLTATSGGVGEAELKSLDAVIPRSNGKYDTDKLSQYLEKVKRRYEQSDTMMVIPGKKVQYQDMINTMDAARYMRVATTTGKKRKMPLFPVVVVSSIVE